MIVRDPKQVLPALEGVVDWFKGLFNRFRNKLKNDEGEGAGPPGAQGGGGTMLPDSTPSETPSEDVINPDDPSPGDDPYIEDTWNWQDYLQGLFASQGHENDINRQYNSAQAAANRQFQSDEARIQRDWYESMSNSAYQRAVADMKNAGINPILAYQNGGAASSGTGISAGSAAAYTATGGDSLSTVLSGVADVIGALSGSSASKAAVLFRILKFLT